MLVNKEEIAKNVLFGETTYTESLNAVLRSMIKEVVETAMGVELTDFLGYEKNKSAGNGQINRRNGYTKKHICPAKYKVNLKKIKHFT